MSALISATNKDVLSGVAISAMSACYPRRPCPQTFTWQQEGRKASLLESSRTRKFAIVAALKERSKEQARTAVQTAKRVGPVQRLLEAQSQLERTGISLRDLLGKSLIASLTFGTAFQVTHNNGLLPEYDVWAFSIGPFLESGLVPLLLAPIWLLYGYAYPLLDQVFANEEAAREINQRANLPLVATTWFFNAAQFILSDFLYLNDVPHAQIYPVMALCTAAIWYTLDRTKTSLILGTLLAVGAPLGEAVIVSFGLWHYARPDNPLGVCFWTAFCYASYGFGVGNFARWQIKTQKQNQRQ